VIEVLERPSAATPARGVTAPDERAARRTLAAQIERLELELAELFSEAWPRKGFEWGVKAPSTRPRLLDLGELEQVRDALAHRVEDARRDLAARRQIEDANRELIADMLRHPERHRWVRVSNADIGEPGCHHWHVVPRWGFIGMFANWWRVKISSGCPLAT
jgi:hypothetical protein